MPKQKIAMLTAGGLAPCLSSAVGRLIERYTELAPKAEIIGYLGGYRGLLKGESIAVTPEVRAKAHVLTSTAARRSATAASSSPTSQGLREARPGEGGRGPLKVAAEQLTRDGITILHTIGGDDTNTTAADLAAISRQERLRAHRRRPAQDGRQRHRADPPVAGRDDRRRAGRDLLRERRQRAERHPAHAARPRGDGPQLRLAHRRNRPRLSRAARAA